MNTLKLLGQFVLGSVFLLTYYYGWTILSHDSTAPNPLLNPLIKNVHGSIKNSNTKNVINILNITSPSSTVLMYNRVIKCGSLTMRTILERLAARNNIDFDRCLVIQSRSFDKQEQERVTKEILNRDGISHIWFCDCYFLDDIGDYNGTLVWMNMVRDPVERFISNFYHHHKNGERDLNECAAKDHPLCTWTVYRSGELQLSFFCGKDPACKKRGNRWALQRAIYHVEKYYSVVGVAEDRLLSYAVLEAYIPMFFTGVKEIEPEKVITHVADPSLKESVTNATRALLKNNLKEDYELYEFIRQRLYAQAKFIGLL